MLRMMVLKTMMAKATLWMLISGSLLAAITVSKGVHNMSSGMDLEPRPNKYPLTYGQLIGMVSKRILQQRGLLLASEDEQVLSHLIEFLIDGSTGRNIFLFYNYGEHAISASAKMCYRRGADVTVYSCRDGISYLQNITMAFNPVESIRNMIVLCSPEVTILLFQEIQKKYLESSMTHWFVILQEDILKKILPLMREGTQVTFSLKRESYIYGLTRSYIDVHNKVALHDLGWWSWDAVSGSKQLLRKPLYLPVVEVYSDFGGRELIATVIDNWPFWILTYQEDGTIIPVSGVDYNVLTTIGEKLNFTYRMEITPDGKWGGVMADGSVTGMVGVVHRHEAHLAINEFTLTASREKAIDFTKPYFYESATLISPAPTKSLKTYAVFTSFTYEVWILLFLMEMLVGPLVILFVKTRRKLFGEVNEKWENLQDVSLMMFRSVVIQGSKVPSTGTFYRIVFFTWFFFTFIIITLYSDVMISVLGVPSYEKPIDSVYDLFDAIENKNFLLILGCGGNEEFIYSNSSIKIYQDIYKRFDHSVGCIKSWDSAMDRVYSGQHVFSNNRFGAEVRANLRGRSNFHFAANEFYAHGYSIACPNGSPYKLAFEQVLVRLLSHGLVNKYVKDELDKAHRSQDKRDKGPEPIGVIHLQAVFYLWLFGNAMGLFFVIGEMVVKHPR